MPKTAPADDFEIRRQLLRMLMRHVPGSVATNLFTAGCTAYLIWDENGNRYIWGWLLLLTLVMIPRVTWLKRMKRSLGVLAPSAIAQAEHEALLFICFSGLIWGNIVWLAVEPVSQDPNIFAIGALIGLTGASVTPLSNLRNACTIYAICALVPLILLFAASDSRLHIAGMVGTLLYLTILVAYARTTHQTSRDLIRLQLEQRGLIADLQSLDRSRSLFLAGVSHDLRQPVHALAMFVNYLGHVAGGQTGELGSKLQQLSQNSRNALSTINNQITRLLELSRLEAGEAKVSLQPINVTDLFEMLRVNHGETAAHKSIALRFVPSHARIQSDPVMLQSILDNLVSNAVRYTTRGGVLVGSRLRGKEVELQVWDTGPGIEETQIPLLFEAYRRFTDTATSQEGFGLGLALVKKQADLLGYEIIVRSQPGKGSMFGLSLPCDPVSRGMAHQHDTV